MARLNYHHLRYFWAVAHAGSLTRAAAQLHLSPSALSVQIQKLEGQLGQTLFDREGRRLLLTEAGQIALDHADAIFATGSELLATLAEAGARRQAIRVGALATLSRNFQAAFLAPLLRRDDVELVLRSAGLAELLSELEAHRLDVVLVNAPPARDAATPWVAHLRADQPVSLVGHAARLGARRDWRALLAIEPIVLPSLDSSIRTGFDALLEREGITPRIAAEVDDMAMIRILLREDVGLAIVPSIVVRDELDAGEVVEVTTFDELHETFYAITLKRRFPNPLLRTLLGEPKGEAG